MKKIKENDTLVFKYIVKNQTEVEKKKRTSCYYLVPSFWAGNLFIRLVEKDSSGKLLYPEAIPMGKNLYCIESKDLEGLI
ncbi:hypothetical protein [Clostridium tagluense]|nr:hypothetical protein [Clostridium tagluense]